jgi:NNP family nitrate/nitrite transporter-like MFS transporter
MIGGLGGFFLPVAFGVLNDVTGLWSSCFMLLFALVAGLFVWMDISVRRIERHRPVSGQTFTYAAE